MLDDLVGTIKALKERIRIHSSDLQANETRTRMALINPLLQTLEWDTADPALVTPEYASDSGPVDYALRSSGDKPTAFIEAKKLGESLSKHREQMVRYANIDGVPYAGLTDGNYWEFYEVFKEKRLEDRRLLQISIAQDPTHECALKLLLLWRPNLSSVQPTQTNKPIAVAESKPNPEPAKAPPSMPEPNPEPAKVPPSSASGQKNTKWVALSDDMFRGRISGGSGAPPLEIKFPDEYKNTIKAWKDILMRTAEWLDSKGLLVDIPIYSREGQTCIVNTEQNHPNGKPFRKPRRLKRGLWMETRGGKRAVVVTCNLLRACRQNPAEVWVLVAKKSEVA
jgi:hypothetical protein